MYRTMSRFMAMASIVGTFCYGGGRVRLSDCHGWCVCLTSAPAPPASTTRVRSRRAAVLAILAIIDITTTALAMWLMYVT